MSPCLLVPYLNQIYMDFDRLTTRDKLENIKTIG
ncbi:adenylate/guanylate cyclase domain-containing protein [[Phormidium] sp. LEGE 05292]